MGLGFSFSQKFPAGISPKSFVGAFVFSKTIAAVIAIILGMYFLFHGMLIIGLIFLGLAVLIPAA